MRLIGFLLLFALFIATGMSIEAHFAPLPLLIQADYQTCVTVRNAPLLRTPESSVDYRIGNPSNDKGTT